MDDATWILHDSLMDLPGFAEIGLKPKALFDTEIAARLLGLHRFGLAAVTEHYLGITLAKEHSAADWSLDPSAAARLAQLCGARRGGVLIELETMMRRGPESRRQGRVGPLKSFLTLWLWALPARKPHPIPWLLSRASPS